MKTFDYICLKCGERIPIEYNLDGTFTKPLECFKCKEQISATRVSDIVHSFLNPPDETTNPTKEYYTDKDAL